MFPAGGRRCDMVLPCGPIFSPVITPVIRAVVHAATHVRSHIGHHVFHPIRHAVHAIGAHPAATIIGFACRTAPGWTAASLLAVPLLQPLYPLPAQPPTMTPSGVQGLQALGGLTPLAVQPSLGADIPAEGSTSTTPAQRVADADHSPVAPQAVTQPVITAPTTPVVSMPPTLALPTTPAIPSYSTVPPDRVPWIISSEFPSSSQPVPEPSSLLVLTSGFYSLRWLRRRRPLLVMSGA